MIALGLAIALPTGLLALTGRVPRARDDSSARS
jgi:hypothetical protein